MPPQFLGHSPPGRIAVDDANETVDELMLVGCCGELVAQTVGGGGTVGGELGEAWPPGPAAGEAIEACPHGVVDQRDERGDRLVVVEAGGGQQLEDLVAE